MKTLQEIKEILSAKKEYLFEKYPLVSIGIFGSYARGEQNEKSDVDLIVDINGRIGIRFIDLADELEQFLGFKVDLVSSKGIKDRYFNVIKEDIIYV